MRKAARQALSVAAMALSLQLSGVSAQAFGTVDFLGQHSEHRRITLWALSDQGFGATTLSELVGRGGLTFGAVGAPDNPWRGLTGVKAAHCDGGDYFDAPAYPHSKADAQAQLTACRAWMFDHLDQAVTDAASLDASSANILPCRFDGRRQQSAKCDVLEDFGVALHASQDFYAHTNWVDAPAPEAVTIDNPPGMAQQAHAPWIDPRVRDTAIPDALISGCYDGFPEFLHCGTGGSKPRIAHRVLNKDTGMIDPVAKTVSVGTTRRGRIGGNFQQAVSAAIEDTLDKWTYLQSQILARYGERGPRLICLIRSDDPADCSP